MSYPFLLEFRRIGSDRVHFLPSADVVLVVQDSPGTPTVRFVFPHRGVVVIDEVIACAKLSPHFTKCVVGEPRRFIGALVTADQHPLLAPFATIRTIDEAGELLEDLRSSLQVTPDEHDFVELWHARAAGEPLVTSDRRVQRLCLRYAGQAPKVINTIDRLAHTLDADNASGRYNGLGDFADASHLGRVCKAYTGRTPGAWRNMSQTFY